MIPIAFIDEWRRTYSWQQDEYIEQDLLLSKILVDLYSNKLISNKLIFRGGTALHKLFLSKPFRYSEDLDFVQLDAEQIGEILSEIRKIIKNTIDTKPKYEMHQGRALLIYSYVAEHKPNPKMKIKIEINTREHFNIHPLNFKDYIVKSRWIEGTIQSTITTYSIEEILATKLRALYHRKKGRDMFDLWVSQELKPNYKDVILIFHEYLKAEHHKISQDDFLSNMEDKLKNKDFYADLSRLLKVNTQYNPNEAYKYVLENYIQRL